MRTIYKYPLQVEDNQTISMPKGAQVLCVQMQGLKPCIWAIVDSEQEEVQRTFLTVGTGNPTNFPDSGVRYIGTYQMMGQSLVFHLFEQLL